MFIDVVCRNRGRVVRLGPVDVALERMGLVRGMPPFCLVSDLIGFPLFARMSEMNSQGGTSGPFQKIPAL